MALQPHLQASASAARQTHGQNDHGATCSRLQRLKNGIPQGSILAPILYNSYNYDLLTSASQKNAYADNLAFMHSAGDWQAVEGALSQDLVTLAAHPQTWQLKLSWSKMVTSAFHLNNRDADCRLNVTHDGKCLPFTQIPTYVPLTP